MRLDLLFVVRISALLLASLCACSSSRPLPDAGATWLVDGSTSEQPPPDAAPSGEHRDALVTRPEAGAGTDASTSDAALPVDHLPVDPLLIETLTGPVRGARIDETRAFLGIPYGAAPVGELRFAPPQSPASWSDVRDASQVGPSCTQLRIGGPPPNGMSEDCLTLDVYTPDAAASAPVMVFLYGGGFQIGSTAGIPGDHLARLGVVLVAVNYRLGALSLMAHPVLDEALSVPSGNLTLRDQQLALRWVRDNIAAFGGDPERVTLFGQSAGSISTSLHMFAKGSEGLAQRFILESGAAVGGWQRLKTRAEIEASSDNLIRQLCPDAPDVLGCLRSQPASAFAWSGALTPGPSPEFWPHVDGELIPDMPMHMLARGEIVHAPFLVGSTRNEYRFFERLEPAVHTRADLIAMVSVGFTKYATTLLEHYMPASDAGARDAYARIWTDGHFRCPARMLVRGASALGMNGYLFSFDVAPGAHTQDLDYVFDVDATSKSFPDEAPLPPLRSVVEAMQAYWLAFAETGDPNPQGASLPHWPSYDSGTNLHLSISEQLAPKSGLADADCELWEELFAMDVP